MTKIYKCGGVIALGLVFFVLIETGVIPPYNRTSLYTIGINIILAVSLNLITGITGQFSLGHAGFMAIGAYSVAITLLSLPGYLGFGVGLVIGLLLSGGLSLLISIPTLRLKGDYLAIATLGFSEIIRIAFQNMKITGGSVGISSIPKLLTWPILYAFIALSIYLVLAFKHSKYGRAAQSIQEDEIAAEAVGIDLKKHKIWAFTIGVMIASIAGGLYAIQFNAIAPGMFGFSKSVDILVIVVLGGLGSVSGSVLSAIFLGVLNSVLAYLKLTNIQVIIYALALVLIMLYRPKGLMGNKELKLPKWGKRGNDV